MSDATPEILRNASIGVTDHVICRADEATGMPLVIDLGRQIVQRADGATPSLPLPHSISIMRRRSGLTVVSVLMGSFS